MLQRLSIRDVVLIDALDIEAGAGLCALTGETGAGKSILLDALGLALGARGDAGLVRAGAAQASVGAVFQLPKDHPVFALLDEQGIAHEGDGALMLRRQIAADGRSKAFINDQMAGVALLRSVGTLVVDIHGQFETYGLMDARMHRATLDAFAGADSRRVREAWDSWRGAEAERAALCAQIVEARRDQEYWQQAGDDLGALAPQAGEEDALHARRTQLSARAQIEAAFTEARAMLEGEAGALAMLNRAWKTLDRAAGKAGEGLRAATEALDRAGGEMNAALEVLERWFDAGEGGPDTLEAVDDRLHALRAAARKFQCRVDDLPALQEDIARRLAAIRDDDGRLAALERAALSARRVYEDVAAALSKQRVAAAKNLDARIMAELAPIKLEKARFETKITALPEDQWGPDGRESIEFLVATNPGTAAGPIEKVASGGELSRFMLAIKVVLAASSPVATLVFDEVDSGLGGATADAVGERLSALAHAGRQVLVVTHSPQVAARADHHWIVAKGANDGAIRTTLYVLGERASRAQEIARMISGANVTREALAAADRLLQEAS
ncbi:MAG: DNA repair protein RecN [Rhodospirillales bacterium]|nr:DNA repair protein RecN [Alphaproteobacteria bacterium]MCB9987000.1 DNA repair protein RecN [Rhodospirillales bacterium]USO08227.1 MAG: DNA repair protein RecN [Rhodospirillales bacterium]